MFLLIVATVICFGLIGVSALLAALSSLMGMFINRRRAAEGLESLEAFLRAEARGA
jgi:hypothetical protein